MSKSIENSIKTATELAFMPFITAGYPSIEITKEIIHLFDKKHVTAIELGIPFSDPLADGPVIQEAANYAIKNGANLDKIFEMLKDIKEDVSTPIIIFTYLNPIICYGMENFISKIADLGTKGVIVPDLPFDEAKEFNEICKKHNINNIPLIAPTSKEKRIEEISKQAQGFIYLVSSTGVTGVRESFSSLIGNVLQQIKKHTQTPVCIGFGISKKEQLTEIKELNADGYIIGSAITKLIKANIDNKNAILKSIENFTNEMIN